jgi:cytochrome bd-type quinol oxidase subunit 1
VWISLIAFVLVYIALGVADAMLMIRYARKGLPDVEPPREGRELEPIPALTY